MSLALAALADPRVIDAVTPASMEDFDPEQFLLEGGTLYLLATEAGASSALVAAFIGDLVETARAIAARFREHGWTRRRCSHSTRSATSPPCPACRR